MDVIGPALSVVVPPAAVKTAAVSEDVPPYVRQQQKTQEKAKRS